MEKWDFCVYGQDHSEGSKCQWMFVGMIFSESQNILLPNLVWWCSIISQSVMQKNWFTIFNVKVTARAYIIKIWLFLLYLLNCWSVCNQTWFDRPARWEKKCLLWSGSRSQWRFKMSVNVCPDDIVWTAEYFVNKLGMVMQHHEPECYVDFFYYFFLGGRGYLQGQGHSEGLHN